uniref:fibrinogen C domain-containing protein 1-A-like n=1 Tax=Styela clava TaxID=7725 RepID=UPI001939A5DF|nr:fibrinogen C domain-containing protein 1-A-like [Styela clava]
MLHRTIALIAFPDIDDCSSNSCQNGGICIDGVNEFSCSCTVGYRGTLCEEGLPTSCSDVTDMDLAKEGQAGIYIICTKHRTSCYEVFCYTDPDFGDGWVVFQRRFEQETQVDFDVDYEKYVEGFGVLTGEMWLGLQKIYELTNGRHNELLIELTDWGGLKRYALYYWFSLDSPEKKFKLNVDSSQFYGNAGDSLVCDVGYKFRAGGDDVCSKTYKGGWWFGEENCGLSNLNGPYKSLSYIENGDYKYERLPVDFWATWPRIGGDSRYYPMKETKMMFRNV